MKSHETIIADLEQRLAEGWDASCFPTEACKIILADMKEVDALREALALAADRMERTTVFVTSRERIKHPEGTDLWRDYIAEARAAAGVL